MVDGNTLIEWGYKPGAWFAGALAAASKALGRGAEESEIRALVAQFAPGPTVPLREAGLLDFHRNISAEGEDEIANE